MAKNRKKQTPFVFLCLVLICFGIWFLGSDYFASSLNRHEVSSANGVWDLRDFDFSKGFVHLAGKGETLGGVLAEPEDFDAYGDEIRYGGYLESPVNTTRLTILLPGDGLYMAVASSVDYGERTYINGELRMEAGQVGTDAASTVPGYAYLAAEAFARDGVFEVVRQTSTFAHRRGGDPVDLYIGLPGQMHRLVALSTGQSGLVMGIFFALFLVHGLLYIILQRYQANLYFAFLCLGWCLRCGVTGRKLFADWFPGLSWELFFRTEYLMVAVAAVSVFLVVNELFPSALPRWFVRLMLAYSAFYAGLCLLLPTYPLSYWSIICPAVYITASLVMLFFLIRYIRGRELYTEQWAMLLSLLVLMFAATHDVFYYNNLGLFSIMNGLGFMMFAVTQMYAIFCGTMREMELAHQAEREVRMEAETLRRVNTLKEEFLQNLSHELQMPITVVSGFAQLTAQMMDDAVPDRAIILDNMHRVVDEAEHMERMVSSLLDMAALENGSFYLEQKLLDFGQLVKNIIAVYFPLMDSNHNRAVVEVEEGLTVLGDEARLRQVMLNLISNAVKHTENGTVSFAARAEGEGVRMTVSDTGTGIPDQLLPDLFRRFAKDEATGQNGLGLHICMRLIEAHGGKIGIEPNVGTGTSVWFTLPGGRERPV